MDIRILISDDARLKQSFCDERRSIIPSILPSPRYHCYCDVGIGSKENDTAYHTRHCTLPINCLYCDKIVNYQQHVCDLVKRNTWIVYTDKTKISIFNTGLPISYEEIYSSSSEEYLDNIWTRASILTLLGTPIITVYDCKSIDDILYCKGIGDVTTVRLFSRRSELYCYERISYGRGSSYYQEYKAKFFDNLLTDYLLLRSSDDFAACIALFPQYKNYTAFERV